MKQLSNYTTLMKTIKKKNSLFQVTTCIDNLIKANIKTFEEKRNSLFNENYPFSARYLSITADRVYFLSDVSLCEEK